MISKNKTMSSMPAEIYMTSLQLAHHRAVLAVMSANPRATEAQAVELADSMSALVMETLKHFLDREDEPCN